jgi:hypothetical protein
MEFLKNMCVLFFPLKLTQNDIDNNPFDFQTRTSSYARSFNEKLTLTNNSKNGNNNIIHSQSLPRRSLPVTSTPNEDMVS